MIRIKMAELEILLSHANMCFH